eukprot:TRINITY_DN6945_c0_g2_i1.p2 TRINITY_DN6945_c0_g2~~TRINITY_DN6945_c0_g2_i1.p2  ORF type:complete len:110 (-),score=5.48 TRINITY_DN6945_c0_g2_i1:145-474(-)
MGCNYVYEIGPNKGGKCGRSCGVMCSRHKYTLKKKIQQVIEPQEKDTDIVSVVSVEDEKKEDNDEDLKALRDYIVLFFIVYYQTFQVMGLSNITNKISFFCIICHCSIC